MSTVATEAELTAERRSPAPRLPAPRKRPRQRNWLTIWALMLPAIIALIALIAVPVYKMVVLSFEKPNIFTHKYKNVGWANYKSVLGDHEFWTVVFKSVIFDVAAAAATVICGVAVATAMMHMNKALKLAVSTGLLLVWATPQFIGATVWQWFFDTEFGVANWLALHLGFTKEFQHSWYTSQWTAFFVVFLVVVWQSVPFVALAIYGALLTVPEELNEAAEMDGAGPVTLFRRVTLPLIVPVLIISTLLSVIWDFRVLTQIAFTTQGAPYGQTNLLGPYIYQKAISSGAYGVASAIGVVVTVMLMGLSYFYVKIMRREDQ
ncbi:MAG: N,N-diacetylchitobiose transport system permease protein [Frankiaceae bacterium]|nr:N,N-diacetylchitobiose transport system permease protein [Frankiaceae bacterium]